MADRMSLGEMVVRLKGKVDLLRDPTSFADCPSGSSILSDMAAMGEEIDRRLAALEPCRSAPTPDHPHLWHTVEGQVRCRYCEVTRG